MTNFKRGFTLIELIVVMAVFLFVIGAAVGIFISIIQNQKRVLAEQQLLNQISYVQEYMSKALRMAKTAELQDSGCIPKDYIYLLTRQGAGNKYRGIKFINQTGDSLGNPVCQEFFLAGIGSANDPYILKELIYVDNNTNDSSAVDLTSSNVKFDSANPIRFSINGEDGSVSGQNGCADAPSGCGAVLNVGGDVNAAIQPRVTLLMNVAIANNSSGKVCVDSSQCSSGQTCITNKCVPVKAIQTTVSRRNLNVPK